MSGPITLPPRTDLDIEIDRAWWFVQAATGKKAVEAARKRYAELLAEREKRRSAP